MCIQLIVPGNRPSLSIHLSIHLSVNPLVHLSVSLCISIFICLPLHLHINLFVHSPDPLFICVSSLSILSAYSPINSSIHLYVHSPIKLTICLSLYQFICLSTHLSIYIHLSVHSLVICLSFHSSVISQSVCPATCPSIPCKSIRLSVCLSIHLLIYPSICLSVHLSILLSVPSIHYSVGLCGLLWAMFAKIDFFADLCSLGSRLSENEGCPIFQSWQPLLICINPRWPPNIPKIAYLSI